jgi:sulfur-oxidizing protein SoxY
MPTRRQVMTGSAAFAAASLLHGQAVLADHEGAEHLPAGHVEAAIRQRTGGAQVNRGRVSLGIPQIAENGLAVFTTVDVESPMTTADHVKAIHLISEKNPIAQIASFRIGPRAGRAKVSTNIRLGGTQRVTALAEMSDGSFWADEKSVIVTIAACIDGG